MTDGRQDSRGYRHPRSMSSRAIPSCSLSPRIIKPLNGRAVIRFLDIARKSGLRASFFLAFFLSGTFPCLRSRNNPWLRLYLAGKGENHPSVSHNCLFDKPFLPLRPVVQQTKASSDTFRNLVLVLRQEKLFRFFWIYFCVFLFLWRPLNGLDFLSVVPFPET